MALPSEQSSISYVGNNSTVTPYPIPFKFFDASDIVVTVTSASGVVTELVLNSDYSVIGGDPEAGATGSLTTTVAIPSTSTVLVERTVEITQDTVYTGIGKFPSASVDHSLDKLTMIDQQLEREIDRNDSAIQPFARLALATDAETVSGLINTKATSPHGVKAAINAATFSAGSYVAATIEEAQDGTDNAKVMTPLRVAQREVATFPALSATEQSITDAIASALAAGGGTVLLPNAEVTLTAPLPVRSGLGYKGFPIVTVFPSGIATSDMYPVGGPGNGTLLRGDGTFNIFEGNAADRTTGWPSSTSEYAEGIKGFSLKDVAVIDGLNGMKVGGRNNPGLYYSDIDGFYAFDCVKWGVWMENYILSTFSRIYPVACLEGGVMKRMSSRFQGGNSQWTDVYVVTPGFESTSAAEHKARGIVYSAVDTSIFGSDSSRFEQCNRQNITPFGGGSFPFGTGYAGTTTNGSAVIAVSDGTAFAVDMPVSFAATAAGFTASKIYFVRSISGNNITLSNYMRGPAVLATASTTITIGGSGFPPIEFIGYTASDTAAAQTPSSNQIVFSGVGDNPDFITCQRVVITTTGTCPGLTPGTEYYLIKDDATHYRFATTYNNAYAGTAITLSSAWTGTATMTGTSLFGATGPFDALDLESSGTAMVVAQNCVQLNLFAQATSASGGAPGSGIIFVQGLVARKSSNVTFRGQNFTHDCDSTSQVILTGPQNMTAGQNVGSMGLSPMMTNSIDFFGFNINPFKPVDQEPTFQLHIGVTGQWTKPGDPIGVSIKTVDTTSLTMGMSNMGAHVVYNGSTTGTWTFPEITNDTGSLAMYSMVGQVYTIENDSDYALTLTTSASQVIDDVPGLTQTFVYAHSTQTFVASINAAGILHWAEKSRSQANYNAAFAYASTVTVDARASEMNYIDFTGDMTLANPTGTSTARAGQRLFIRLAVGTFTSGTRALTFGSAFRNTSAYVPPIVTTDSLKQTMLTFFSDSNGRWYLQGANEWGF